MDNLPPADSTWRAAAIGETKAAMAPATVLLAVLAGAFIALGAAFSTTVAAGSAPLPYGAPVRRGRGRPLGAHGRRGKERPRVRPRARAGHPLQRARLPRDLAHVPLGLLVEHDAAFVASAGPLPDRSSLMLGDFLLGNLLPVTIGNVIGGALMVGLVYWLVYLRSEGAPAPPASRR